MANLARACLRLLVFYAVAAVAVGLLVYHRMPVMPVAIWSGVIAGFFVWLTFAYLVAIPGHIRDWSRMRPGAALRNGKRTAVIGTIQPAGPTLDSPFTRTPCVAYLYKVISFRGQNPSNDFEGFAMVPSSIRTENGSVKILAYPDLEMQDEHVRGPEVKRNAREFIDATTFLNIRKEGIKAATAELAQLQADDDGSMRYDHRIDPVDELDSCRLTERVLRPGETVCAVGVYSEERQALVPDRGALVHALTITKGTPESFRWRALRKAFGSAIGVVICGGLVTAAAVVFALNVPMDASEQKNPGRRFLWEEVRLERWLEKNVRMPLVKAGTLSTPGMYFLELCTGCASGRLEANGRILELRRAALSEDEKTRRIHLSAEEGAKDGVTITFDKTRPPTPEHELPWTIIVTLNGRDFPVPADWTLPRDVQTAAGSDHLLDGRVSAYAPNGSVRIRAAFRVELGD